MNDIASFLRVFDAFCAARGIGEDRGSTLVFNAGHRVGEIRAGRSDVGVKRLERALAWLSANWPEDAAWPQGVARPDPAQADPAEAA